MKKNGRSFKSVIGTPFERLAKIRGVGDIVAIVAEPVAQISDAVFHTKLKGCVPCKDRQRRWNKKLPLQRTYTEAAEVLPPQPP